MESKWAEENLQVIRTLMERSAIYRRALAPVMTVAGVLGIGAAVIPCFVELKTPAAFCSFWLGVAVVVMLASFAMVRRQALKSDEPLWSAPALRVAEALRPGFFVGAVISAAGCFYVDAAHLVFLTLFWVFVYGCALHAAGFFMPRGIRLFAWVLIVCAGLVLFWLFFNPGQQTPEMAHYLMGTFFGVLHLAYGIYLHFTENRTNEA